MPVCRAQHLVAEREKNCEGVAEVMRRAWAEDAASQSYPCGACPARALHNNLIISCHGHQWEVGTNCLVIIVMTARS